MRPSPYNHCGVPLYELDLPYSTNDTRLFCGRFNTDWRFVVLTYDDNGKGNTAMTGPYYRSMRELLADADRFAADYGLITMEAMTA